MHAWSASKKWHVANIWQLTSILCLSLDCMWLFLFRLLIFRHFYFQACVKISDVFHWTCVTCKFWCHLQGLWTSAIKYHLKNLRKTKRPMPLTPVPKDPKEARPPKFARRAFDKSIPSLPDGETPETCSDHVANMKKKMGKTSTKNLSLVKDLMAFPTGGVK